MGKGIFCEKVLSEKRPIVISMGKKSGRRARRRGNSGRFFRFFLSNGMSICVLPGLGRGRIVAHSEQQTLRHTVYSTIEHGITNMRVCLT